MSALNRVSQSLKKPAKPKKKVKHKKLDEDWFDTRETIKDGMNFSVKYLGLTLVDEEKGEKSSSAAVQRIVDTAKASNTKTQKVQLTVSSGGIKVHDQTGTNLINDISVYRISFCAAVKQHNKVFAYVAQNEENETMECHAYLCNTTKEAQELAVTVAQSFKIAFEICEEEGNTIEVENAIPDSDLKIVNGEKGDKRATSVIKTSVIEKRYKRLSSSGSNAEQEVTEQKDAKTESEGKTAATDSKQPDGQPIQVNNEVFVFPKTKTTSNQQQQIVPIRPPPASGRQTDKPSPRRSQARPSSVGGLIPPPSSLTQSHYTPSPSKTVHDVEDWDQGFADLALSRTKDKTEVETEEASSKAIYPPSNPFFNPHNPFYS